MRHLTVSSLVLAAVLVPGGTMAAGPEPPGTGDFAEAGSMEQARVDHTATVLTDGRVLVVGGQDGDYGDVYFETAEVWDPATGSFSPAGALTQARTGHSSTSLPDGRVLVIGGYDGVSTVSEAEIWDPATSSFSPAGSLESGRVDHVATLLPDGRVLIVGGEHQKARDWLPAPAQVWEPITETFSPVETLSEPLLPQTATLLSDGRVLLVGSESNTAQVWDPKTEALTPAGKLGRRLREDHVATLLSDGRVLFVGDSKSAHVWDPATASFSPAGSLAERRIFHTTSLLPDGRGLIVGDCCQDHRLASAEVWDPMTHTFSPAGWLITRRHGHTATALPDGRVLVVGGWGRDPDACCDDIALASAELWDPDREWIVAQPMPRPKGLRDLLDRRHPRTPFSTVRTTFERASREPQAMRSLQGVEPQQFVKSCQKARDNAARFSGCSWLLRSALRMYVEVLSQEAWDAVKAAYDYSYNAFPRSAQRNGLDRVARFHLTDSVKTVIDLVDGTHPRVGRKSLIADFERKMRTSTSVFAQDTDWAIRQCRKAGCEPLLFYAVAEYLLEPTAKNWRLARDAYAWNHHQSTSPAQRKQLRGTAIRHFESAADEYGAAQSFGPLMRGALGADGVDAFFTGFTASTSPDEECTEEPRLEVIDGVERARDKVIGCTVWVTTDPRMNGESVSIWNSDERPTSGGVQGGTILSARERIVTESGSWEGTLTGLAVDRRPSLMSGWFVGEGAHDGLMAYVMHQNDGESLWGYISPEPPPMSQAVPER